MLLDSSRGLLQEVKRCEAAHSGSSEDENKKERVSVLTRGITACRVRRVYKDGGVNGKDQRIWKSTGRRPPVLRSKTFELLL